MIPSIARLKTEPVQGARKAEGPEVQPVCKALGYWDDKSEEKILRTMTTTTVKNDTISYGDSRKLCFFVCLILSNILQ